MPPRFFRRRDGRLHPVGWLLLGLGAALFVILMLFGVTPISFVRSDLN